MGKWTIVCGCAQEGRGILIRCVGEVGYNLILLISIYTISANQRNVIGIDGIGPFLAATLHDNLVVIYDGLAIEHILSAKKN
jgi:hypothetical protein